MNTLKAYMKKLDAVKNGATMMFFDWNKAATIIKERQPVRARAGLTGDFEWTGNVIYQDGNPRLVDEDGDQPYTFLGSCWAVPLLILEDYKGDEDEFECFTTDNEREYTTGTYWPKEAIALL